MKTYRFDWVRNAAAALIAISWTTLGFAQEPLPSWNDTAPKGDLKGALAGGEAAIGKSQQLDSRKHERRLETHIRVRREIVREAFCCLIARFR
jgi:hypothetical protein